MIGHLDQYLCTYAPRGPRDKHGLLRLAFTVDHAVAIQVPNQELALSGPGVRRGLPGWKRCWLAR
jgi:hypothetical protein